MAWNSTFDYHSICLSVKDACNNEKYNQFSGVSNFIVCLQYKIERKKNTRNKFNLICIQTFNELHNIIDLNVIFIAENAERDKYEHEHATTIKAI